jgi:hypothetical protein
MIYYVGSTKHTYEYAEAWRMTAAGKSGKRKRQLTLDQGGDDSFLVPNDAWADDLGTPTITTAAWFEEGKVDSSFTPGEGTELWRGRVVHTRDQVDARRAADEHAHRSAGAANQKAVKGKSIS